MFDEAQAVNVAFDMLVYGIAYALMYFVLFAIGLGVPTRLAIEALKSN